MVGTTRDMGIVRLCLICRTIPPEQHEGKATEFGLQDNEQNLVAGTQQADGSIHYAFTVRAGEGRTGATPRFSGPCVHGTAAAPFLYLGWRLAGAEQSSWIRRLKVPLGTCSWEQVRAVRDIHGGCLEATVDGTGSGTVPLLGDGWTPRTMIVAQSRA